jgi:hypothetical protein
LRNNREGKRSKCSALRNMGLKRLFQVPLMIEQIKLGGDNMSTRAVKARSALFIGVIFFSTALFIQALGGCASTPPGPGPGTPDEIQIQHYEMVKSAIEAKDRVNALAALALFEADIFRWHTNTLTEAVAITELLALTDAVDKEEWASANKKLTDLKAKYRPE